MLDMHIKPEVLTKVTWEVNIPKTRVGQWLYVGYAYHTLDLDKGYIGDKLGQSLWCQNNLFFVC